MVTLVYAYFNNGSMLDLHLDAWQQYKDKEEWRAIIVDDCSLQDPAEAHLRDVGFPIELYRIHTDIPWNQDGARNLAMHHASGWCLMTDMDHLLTPEGAGKVRALRKSKHTAYLPSRVRQDGTPYHPHPNSYILHSDLFARVGGYDESYAGYYGTDSIFRAQLAQFARLSAVDIALRLYSRDEVPDASTTQYGRKGSEYHISRSPALSERRRLRLSPIAPLNFEWSRIC